MLVVARAMIGKLLVHESADGVAAGRIVETEAYRGPADLAAHSAGGRRTTRTEAMYGPPGHAYVFLLYGLHWAFNVVTGLAGDPHAVLVRAIVPVVGTELMAARRGLAASRRELTNGPGKLSAALGIDRSHYAADLCTSSLYLAEPGPFAPRGKPAPIGRSARINVDYAGPVWAKRPWRFYERGCPWVSVAPRT